MNPTIDMVMEMIKHKSSIVSAGVNDVCLHNFLYLCYAEFETLLRLERHSYLIDRTSQAVAFY